MAVKLSDIPCTVSEDELWRLPVQTEPIPRLRVCDPEAIALMKADKPVVLVESDLVTSALHWDLPYLTENMGDGDCTVFSAQSRVFKYFDSDKNLHGYEFASPCERQTMTFKEFANRFQTAHSTNEWHYMQQVRQAVLLWCWPGYWYSRLGVAIE
jgi:hypoxia-inducible factor 1-alpha inhibitor (HIF hydroxylase)